MIKKFLFSKKGCIVISIVFIVFIVIVLPVISKLTESVTHTSFSPDTAIFYSTNEFYEAMEIYGKAGRDFYVLLRWTFDVIWPLVYFSFLISVLGHLTRNHPKERRLLILLIPLVSVIFDFFENTFATLNVVIYPSKIEFLIVLLQGMSLMKWFFIVLAMLAIIYSLIVNIVMRKKSKISAS